MFYLSKDTLSKETPPEVLTREKKVEFPKNRIFFLAKDERTKRLECLYAVKVDSDNKQTNKLVHFQFYLEFQIIIMK